MSELLQKAQEFLKDKLPFVIYSKPNELQIVGLFQNDDSLNYTKDFTEKGFVFAPFEGEKFILIPENSSEILVENYENVSDSNASDFFDEINFSAKEKGQKRRGGEREREE